MKRFTLIATIALLMVGLCAGVFSTAAEATDPADVYVPQIAEHEDPSIDLWFEHSFKKVMTSDTTPSDMETYSVYMGKNEIENAQFVLYSDETKEKMRVSIADFKDENGNTVDAEIYYQMYVTLSNIGVTDYVGATTENTFLRNGEQPDPIVPASKIGRFQLNGGKSQAFYIRLKTTEDSVSGWYSSQLKVLNSSGQVVKTATVYAYVWDFTIEEETVLKTSFYMNNRYDAYGSYKEYYDYFLENRMLLMDVPGELNSSNPYLTNPRVNAIRVTASNGGNTNTYMESYAGLYYQYADIYTDLSSMKEWEEIKDKFYFYTVDEPMSAEHQDKLASGANSGHTVDDVKFTSETLAKYWPNAATVVPYHENHPYPYYTYNAPMASLDTSLIKDATQEMIDTASCTIWCPKMHGLTPMAELEANNYDGANPYGSLRGLNATISGAILHGERYFNWDAIYGDFSDRVLSNNIIRNRDENNNDELWVYTAGQGGSYTNGHHLIENTGIQTKMLFWQMYQEDATGYLYYDVSKWEGATDNTVTGNRTGSWKYNLGQTGGGGNYYGGGVLFYPATQGGLTNVDYIGTIRVEMIRDGIEEYQMMTMLEELKGNAAADAIVDSVSKNVANYLTLPNFDRSAFDPSMDDYDVLAAKRIELGNQLEAASKESACEHDYGEGVVTKDATCLDMGERTYTCNKCGAVQVEYIPTIHAEGDHWNKTVVTPTGCTVNGKTKYECTICGYTKYMEETAYHNNTDLLVYEVHEKMTNVHNITCPLCNELIDSGVHTYRTEYTNDCVNAGVQNDVCIYCGHTEKVADVEAHGHNMKEYYKAPTCEEAGLYGGKCFNCGYEEAEEIPSLQHNYVDGKCENCGEADPDAVTAERGDIDGNGTITMTDLFRLKLFVKQIATPTEEEIAAADVNGDGTVNMVDSFDLKYRIAKGIWRN